MTIPQTTTVYRFDVPLWCTGCQSRLYVLDSSADELRCARCAYASIGRGRDMLAKNKHRARTIPRLLWSVMVRRPTPTPDTGRAP